MWWPSRCGRKKKKALEVCAEFGSGDLLLSGDPTGPDSREREREGHLPMGERLDRDKVIGLRHHERGKGERKMGGSKVGVKQNGLYDGSGEEE